MPESFKAPLDDRRSALENFVENSGPQYVHWNGLQAPPAMLNGYGRSQPAIGDDERLRAAIHAPKVQDVSVPAADGYGRSQHAIADDERLRAATHAPQMQDVIVPATDGYGRVTKQRGKRPRAKSEGSEEPQRPTPTQHKGSSKHYGVRFRPDLQKYVAEIRVWEWKAVDKKVWLGTFDTEDKAGRGVDLARKLLNCRKKRPYNLPCPELAQYNTKIPAHLDLTDIANEAMFKQVVNFIKAECQRYSTGFISPPGETSPLQHPPTQPLGYDEVDLPWNDIDDYDDVGLYSDSDLAILPSPPAHHSPFVLPDASVEPHLTDEDMAEIFDDAVPPISDLDTSSSPMSTPPSSFTLPELYEFQFQTAPNEIARGASPPQRRRLNTPLWESPVCHDLDHLPQTWPGSTTSADLLPLHSGSQSEMYVSPVDVAQMTYFETGNQWLLQDDQFQFQMDLG